jgi:RNA polymerase sigma-70 factor (ECF subfamily)
MIAMVRGLHRFDGRSSFSTWAYRIATNASLDELRRRRRRPMSTGGDERHAGPEFADPSAVGRVDAVADRDALDDALRAVPEDFRVPVVLRDVGDLDYAEIAITLGVPIGTVKSRIARGRAMLAAAFTERAGNPAPGSQRPTGAS